MPREALIDDTADWSTTFDAFSEAVSTDSHQQELFVSLDWGRPAIDIILYVVEPPSSGNGNPPQIEAGRYELEYEAKVGHETTPAPKDALQQDITSFLSLSAFCSKRKELQGHVSVLI